mmetsp:Transcript_20634/g.34716  ORF Transcript_20634/g.34716 Transcript_20634/m.34716 type:complete len:700 (+) Transcript_20634:62-2161(+)
MPTTVCYASETGTAEDVAFKIVKRAELLNIDVEIVAIDDYNIESLPTEQTIVFVCSTTGDGEIPTSMRKFWKFILRKSLPRNSLEGVNFSIFGLGDSGYDKFNAVARRLNSRMKQLGATEMLSIGLGDDQGAYGYLTALDPWMDQLFSMLVPLTPGLQPSSFATIAPPQYTITTIQSPAHSSDLVQAALEQNPPLGYQTSTNAPVKATVISNTRLTTPSWQQNVFHVAMSIPPHPITSETSQVVSPSHVAGDVLIVYPTNSPELVAMAESYFSAEFPDPANTVINIQFDYRKNSRKNRLLSGQCTATIPTRSLQCTVRDLFTRFLGLSNVPQRGYFEELSRFVPVLAENTDGELSAAQRALLDENEEEREKLVELASAEGADLYDSYCFQEQRGYMEILNEFRTLRNGQVPLHRFLEMVPPLLPRHYSIASSGHKTPNLVELCIAEVSYKTPLGRSRSGVASSFLSLLKPADEVHCYVRKGTFPSVPLEAPLLLVGPGTGVAPMRALMHERIALATSTSHVPSSSQIDASIPVNDTKRCLTTLLFGCRSQVDDYLYEHEWKQCVQDVMGNGRVVLNCTSLETDEILAPFDFTETEKGSANIKLDRAAAVVVSAFSRNGRNAGRRVTHSIQTHQKSIWSLIQREDAFVLVAGSASTKMPSDVRKALVQVCVDEGGLSVSDAQKYLLQMEKSRRFCVEAWS